MYVAMRLIHIYMKTENGKYATSSGTKNEFVTTPTDSVNSGL